MVAVTQALQAIAERVRRTTGGDRFIADRCTCNAMNVFETGTNDSRTAVITLRQRTAIDASKKFF